MGIDLHRRAVGAAALIGADLSVAPSNIASYIAEITANDTLAAPGGPANCRREALKTRANRYAARNIFLT
jgi:hypothetical protein